MILPLAKIYQPIWTYDVKTLQGLQRSPRLRSRCRVSPRCSVQSDSQLATRRCLLQSLGRRTGYVCPQWGLVEVASRSPMAGGHVNKRKAESYGIHGI